MSSITTQLWNVLNSLGESSQFCTSGSTEPVLPGLEVEGIGNVGVPVSATDAKRIIKQASQAPYGRGEETIVDTNVRRVWQLEPGQFELRNTAWDKSVDGIVQSVRKEFGIRKKVQHELYKLLVYEKGSFFAPHRDTEKIPGTFATLVVCLPSRHEGGTLIVSHDGLERQVEFGGAGSEFNVQYAAFYADCQHEIKPAKSGYRVCLVYNLALARQKPQPSAPANSQAVEAAAELLPKFFADEAAKKGTGTIRRNGPEGASHKLYPSPFSRDKIVLPFKHQYSEAALDPRELKGADRSLMAVLARAAETIGDQTFVALLTHYRTGIPNYGTIDFSYSRSRADTPVSTAVWTMTSRARTKEPSLKKFLTSTGRSPAVSTRKAASNRSGSCALTKMNLFATTRRRVGPTSRRSARQRATKGLRWSVGIAKRPS